MPVYMHRQPTFEVAPINSPLKVLHEQLTFDVSGSSSSEALVTAEYTLENPSSQSLTVPMIFPSISEYHSTPLPHITLNGSPLEYEVYSVGSAGATEQVDINAIISSLNSPAYVPTHIDDSQNAVLYKITLAEPMDRRSRVSFRIDPLRTKVVASGFSGMGGNRDGEVEFSTYVGPGTIEEAAYILVLGDDTLEGLSLTEPDTIEKTQVVIKDFLMDQTFNNEAQWRFFAHRNVENFYSLLLQELERPFFSEDTFLAYRNLEDIVHSALEQNNLSVFLYEVDVEAVSTSTLSVSYHMRATIDRRNSSDYVQTFAYVLSPASYFASFGTLDIEVFLSDHAPYIIDSSLPLQESERGRYTGTFDTLPEVDLVFSTYAKPEVSLIDKALARIMPNNYVLVMLALASGALLVVAAIILVAKKHLSRL